MCARKLMRSAIITVYRKTSKLKSANCNNCFLLAIWYVYTKGYRTVSLLVEKHEDQTHMHLITFHICTQIPRSEVVRYTGFPEDEQYSQVDFCPHLIYIVEGTTTVFRPLKCRINVRGANSYGGPVFFMLTSPIPSGI